MDRLTRQDVEAVLGEGMCKVRCSEPCLCSRVRDLALQSLSQETVRDEALEMPEDAETLEWEFEFSDTRRQVIRRVVWREDYDKLRGFTIRALKREPNAAPFDMLAELKNRLAESAPAAPDVAVMVRQLERATKYRSGSFAELAPECVEDIIALLAKLGQGWALDPRELKLLIDYHDAKGCEAEAMGVNGSVRYHDKRRAHYEALLPPGASDE